MSRREKTLGAIVFGAIVLLALFRVAKSFSPMELYRSVEQELQAAQDRKSRLEKTLAREQNVTERWQEQVQRTFSADPNEVQARFREDLNALLGANGLESVAVVKRGGVRTQKNGFAEAPFTIQTKGTLAQFVGFLRDFYQRGYLAQLSSATITSDAGTRKPASAVRTARQRLGRASEAEAAGEPELTISMTTTALVLPVLKGLPHAAMEEIDPNAVAERLEFADDPTAYDVIADANIFRIYEPPVAAPPPLPDPVVVQAEPPAEVPTPVVRTPPRNTNLVVVGTATLEGRRVAFVADEQRRDEPPAEYHVNDELDDGRVILIHPEGVVVAVEDRGRHHITQYFCPLGVIFEAREEVDPSTHPELFERLGALGGEADS